MKNNSINILLFIIFNCLGNVVYSQISFSIGITSNIGTSVDRIGVYILPQIRNEFIQCNARAGITYNLRSFGTMVRGPELQMGVGIVVPFGVTDSLSYSPIDLVSNQSAKRYSIAYAYNRYFDKAGTSQFTGIIGFQTNKLRFITENDILSFIRQDRYRTAAAMISYIDKMSAFSIKTILWTGDSFDHNAIKVTNDTIYRSRFGYKDLSKAAWGKYSVGIFCFQVERAYSAFSTQTAKAMVGVDAEQVRQIFQNKFIHDMYFVPERFIGYKNVHYPMLQDDGTPCLMRQGQKVRKPRPFFNVGLNDNLFY